MSPQPADDGLQQERTTLAWRRTGLSVAIAALVIGRLTATALGPTAVVLTALGATGAAWMTIATLRRGRFAAGSSVETAFDSVLADGRAPALLASVTCLLAAVEVAAILLG